jgi:hypothetical protein
MLAMFRRLTILSVVLGSLVLVGCQYRDSDPAPAPPAFVGPRGEWPPKVIDAKKYKTPADLLFKQSRNPGK